MLPNGFREAASPAPSIPSSMLTHHSLIAFTDKEPKDFMVPSRWGTVSDDLQLWDVTPADTRPPDRQARGPLRTSATERLLHCDVGQSRHRRQTIKRREIHQQWRSAHTASTDCKPARLARKRQQHWCRGVPLAWSCRLFLLACFSSNSGRVSDHGGLGGPIPRGEGRAWCKRSDFSPTPLSNKFFFFFFFVLENPPKNIFFLSSISLSAPATQSTKNKDADPSKKRPCPGNTERFLAEYVQCGSERATGDGMGRMAGVCTDTIYVFFIRPTRVSCDFV